jgi:hypothetical protein
MGWCAPARIIDTNPGMSGASKACLPASSSNNTHLPQQQQHQEQQLLQVRLKPSLAVYTAASGCACRLKLFLSS